MEEAVEGDAPQELATQTPPPPPRNIQKDLFVEVGKGVSPNFRQVLELLHSEGEYLAFAPDTEVSSAQGQLETYLQSDSYGYCNFVECIQIRNRHKVYSTEKGNCCAVNSLSLTLFENQSLALLGHNGAGKSTTISMLEGLLRPTSGDAFVFGKNIKTSTDVIRKILGVCPKNDILFPELTVREHLEIYAVLKGVKENLINTVVNEMIDEVGLSDKVNTTVLALFGGMKRKLSLGIAFIGISKVIVFNEPTSGMDPYSMRLTWQLIKKKKKGQIVLLTTHSMYEVEEWGDRIAIMANGSLKCCGSSLYLKHQYGVGYTLTLVKSAPSSTMASNIVHRHIPSAQCVSEVREMA